MGDPKWRGGGGVRGDQIMGGTKMMGVQLDRGPNFGLHRGMWGTQNGGGRPKTRGNQNDGGAVGRGTQFWVAPWNMGDSEWGGTPNRSGAKMEAGRKRGEKTKVWGFLFLFFLQERGENSGQPAMISKNKPRNCPKFDKFTLKMNPKIAQNLINLP